MIKLVLISILTSFSVTCSNLQFESLDIPFITIGKGSLGGAGDEGITKANMVISNSEEWHHLLDKVDRVNEESAKFAKGTIDFKSNIVIAIFDEVRSSGGFDLEISSIIESGDDVIVNIKRIEPGPVSVNVFTQPFHIVKIKKTNKRIVFE